MKWLTGIVFCLFLIVQVSVGFAAEIGLAWDSNTEGNMASYRVYQTINSGSYPDTWVREVPHIWDVDTQSVLLQDVPDGTWFWVVTAYNTEGDESGYSNEVTTTVAGPSLDITPPAIPTGFEIDNIQPVAAVIEAESGILVLPMQIVSETPGLVYIQTPVGQSGTASYMFNIDVSGTYKIIAGAQALDDSANSFWVKIDDQEEDIWDLNPTGIPNEFNVWREDEVTKRGIGTFDAPQYDPYTIELVQGTHTITFRGREPETKLNYFYFLQYN